MSNAGRVALVTGGSRGIGEAIVSKLAAEGCRVVFSYVNNATAAATLVGRIENDGGEALAVCADVAVAASASALVDTALARFGAIDILVNNAGIASNATLIADTPVEQWQRILDVNLNGTFHMVRTVVPHMRARASGHIVNLSSNVTQRMPASFGPYTISKSAIEALTRILAREEGAHGIRVNAVAPGPIRTEMLADLLERMGTDKARAFVQSVPLGRAGEVEEIAAMVAMLVSDVASYVTGQVIYVNGGGPGG